jgi:hypothetical protein
LNRLVTQLNYKDYPLQLLQCDVFIDVVFGHYDNYRTGNYANILSSQIRTTDFVKHIDCLFYRLPVLFSYLISETQKPAKV